MRRLCAAIALAALGCRATAPEPVAAKDPAAAREEVAAAIDRALGGPEDPETVDLLARLGRSAHERGVVRSAEKARIRVLEVRSRTLLDDDPDLQTARAELASTLRDLGDLPGARALQEKVLDVRSRLLPADHPDVLAARQELGLTLRVQGDLAGAQAHFEAVLEARERTLGDDDPDLARARMNLANAVRRRGDFARSEKLETQALEVFERVLPPDHIDLARARQGLAATLYARSEYARARSLEEQALDSLVRTLPPDHIEVARARGNLAGTMKALDDLLGARSMQEQVLDVFSRTLPPDHPDLVRIRAFLATTLQELGELHGARELLEQVVETHARRLPEDHPDLVAARANLALCIKKLGDLDGARAMQEQVLESRRRTFPREHRYHLAALQSLAGTIGQMGDLDAARPLVEEVLEIRSRQLPEQHSTLQGLRRMLCSMIAHQAARDAVIAGEIPSERRADVERCRELLLAYHRSMAASVREALLSASPREAEARCEKLSKDLDLLFSFARGLGVEAMPELERPLFESSEGTRGAALASAALIRAAAGQPDYASLREDLVRWSRELAALAQRGATSAEFQAAVARRDETQRRMIALARELPGGSGPELEIDVERVTAGLAADEAVVAYRRCRQWSFRPRSSTDPSPVWGLDEIYFAFVVRSTGLVLVELGSARAIEEAVQGWRAGLGAGGEGRGVAGARPGAEPSDVEVRGREIRQLAIDPLRDALVGAHRVVFVLDDVLHLVPIDALPAGETSETARLGDRLRIESRVTLSELFADPGSSAGDGELVVVGGVAYGEGERDGAGILRGGAWAGGFADLPATDREASAIAQAFAAGSGAGAPVTLLRGARATRDRLFEAAPRARWLHVATHGWFAAESIPSWEDDVARDGSSPVPFSSEEQVQGMSPMLLCGLALAGANLPASGSGRAAGLVTAEEIAALDLSGCELAVLSACDTNVGVRRAGQGVASLQRALQMAGARSVITSLWKVPDEATRELMTDFYRRLWAEKKPKGQALWEAKRALRDAGRPLRDWAAWVLTGEP